MLMYFFCRFFLECHPVYDQTQGSGAVFSLLYTDNSIEFWAIFAAGNSNKFTKAWFSKEKISWVPSSTLWVNTSETKSDKF
jgi:hypothetical protein